MDLDSDGHVDLLSGSWPGEIHLFRGGPNRTFAPPVKLRHKTGKLINPTGGIQRNGDQIGVAGDATFEKNDKGRTVIVYDGERIEIPEGKQGYTTGTATAVHAADWDGDGKLDLIVGEIRGAVFLVPNVGTAAKPEWGDPKTLTAGGKELRVEGDAGPFVADWDGDGKPDLLVGAGDGAVTFFRNAGTAKAPDLAAGVTLVPASENRYGRDTPKEPKCGTRSKVCVADWNGDGRPDLLLGDFATQKPDRPEPTAAEKAEHERVRKELEPVQKRFRELQEKLIGDAAVKGKAEREQVAKDYQEALARYRELHAKLPREAEEHGWVWLFLRKPAEAATGGR